MIAEREASNGKRKDSVLSLHSEIHMQSGIYKGSSLCLIYLLFMPSWSSVVDVATQGLPPLPGEWSKVPLHHSSSVTYVKIAVHTFPNNYFLLTTPWNIPLIGRKTNLSEE